MASVKVKFRESLVEGREGRIYYQVIHERKVRQVLTDYRVRKEEWDEARSTITDSNEQGRAGYLLSIKGRIKSDLARIEGIIRHYDGKGEAYTVEYVITEFEKSKSGVTLFNEMEKSEARLAKDGRARTSRAYASALKSFRKYRQDEDIQLEEVTKEVMEGYQAWLNQQEAAPNTISFYIRMLRAVYNRAVDEELIDNRRPFRHVYTGVDKTAKRALPLSDIKKIRKLDLSNTPDLEYARDMFILCFMLRGMSIIDMAFLKKTDLANGHVTYRRRKTRQQLTIAWTPEMQGILDRYPENESGYLLPIIRKAGLKEEYAFKNVAERINRNLKKIAELAGIEIPLTMYVARHSWASIAKAKGVPLSVISEGLGHEKESTTRIYLSTLDTSLVDKANGMILKMI